MNLNIGRLVKNGRRKAHNLWAEIPVQFKRKERFNPVEHYDHVYIVEVTGQDTQVYEATEKSDDMTLEYEKDNEQVECAITSLPMLIGRNHFYYTRDGFKGTMALNEDTLLSSDKYIPNKDGGDDGHNGEISSLEGSKRTLRQQNEAKRMRKLLEPQSLDTSTIMLYLGAGAFIGVILSRYVLGGGA